MNTIHTHNIRNTIVSLLFVCVFFSPFSFNSTANSREDQLLSINYASAATDAKPQDTGGGENQTKSFVGQYIGNLILSTASGLTYVGGKLLDISLKKTVFEMGRLVNTPEFGSAIDTAWKLIRDICNLAFIFGFVYLGIRTIIDPDSASTKRTLSQIIIGALLINFSLFIVKFIVDFSNLTAYHIYNAMAVGEGTLSATMADMLGIVSIFGSPNLEVFQNVTTGGMVWFYVLGAILLVIAAFVFAAAAILLVVRFVALILIMVASPVLFAATVFPQTAPKAAELWKKLISYSIFAPVYLLLTLISLTLMHGLGREIVPGGSKFADALKAGAPQDSFGIFLNFTIIIFFLVESLLIAKKLGIQGGDMAESVWNSAQKGARGYMGKAAGGATLGLGARIGRATVGKYAHEVSEDGNLKDRAATSWVARQKLKLATSVADSSFDARNVNGVGKSIGIGEGRKGGYATVKKEVQEKEEKFAKSLGEVGDDDVRVQARKKEWEAAQKTQKAEVERLRKLQREAETSEERARLQGDIDKLEKSTRDAQITYEKEKQRRVIGSTYAKPLNEATTDALKADIDQHNDMLKQRWTTYASLNEADKVKQRSIIESMTESLTEKKDTYAKMMRETDGGYAGTLENTNIFKSWIQGRMVVHEKEAGKAIRKSAEKGLPKEK